MASASSLWDRAYDTLKGEKDYLIVEYERLCLGWRSEVAPVYSWLFSPALTRGNIAQTNALPTLNETEDVGKVTNQTPQHNVVARREKLLMNDVSSCNAIGRYTIETMAGSGLILSSFATVRSTVQHIPIFLGLETTDRGQQIEQATYI